MFLMPFLKEGQFTLVERQSLRVDYYWYEQDQVYGENQRTYAPDVWVEPEFQILQFVSRIVSTQPSDIYKNDIKPNLTWVTKFYNLKLYKMHTLELHVLENLCFTIKLFSNMLKKIIIPQLYILFSRIRLLRNYSNMSY